MGKTKIGILEHLFNPKLTNNFTDDGQKNTIYHETYFLYRIQNPFIEANSDWYINTIAATKE